VWLPPRIRLTPRMLAQPGADNPRIRVDGLMAPGHDHDYDPRKSFRLQDQAATCSLRCATTNVLPRLHGVLVLTGGGSPFGDGTAPGGAP
jgi:hypothetical protein